MSWLVLPGLVVSGRGCRVRGGGGAVALTVVATVVLVLGGSLASCSDGGGDQAAAAASGSRTAAAAGASTPAPTASASAAPSLSAEYQALKDAALAMEEPVPPEGMNENTPDGVALAAGYFIDLYPYVYATGDLTAWEEMSADGCIFCNSVIDNVTELHGSGGWADPWEQQVTLVSYGTDPADGNRYVVEINLVSVAYMKYSGEPISAREVAPSETSMLLQLFWEEGEWVVEEGELL